MQDSFEKFFLEYEKLRNSVEKIFDKIKEEFPKCVKCKPECSDCCYALFDLTLIEALYINKKFNEKFKNEEKNKILEEANKADRRIYKLKKEAFKEKEEGKDDLEIMEKFSKEKIKCPLLSKEKKCRLYDARPITCRAYGVPIASGGHGHICGFSDFAAGVKYPTINFDIVFRELSNISNALVASLNTKHIKMGEILVPLSMAILTEYNDEYLGIKK